MVLLFFLNKAEVSTLISFDEPDGGGMAKSTSDLVSFGNTPQKPVSNSSQSSQNSTNFNIFGDTLMDFAEPSSKDFEESNNMTDKIVELKATIKKYEQEINNYQASARDFQMKFEKIKSELNDKTNTCEKMENQIIKVYLYKVYNISVT